MNNISTAGLGADAKQADRLAHRLWSLWDMINFDFLEAHAVLSLLHSQNVEALKQSLESRRKTAVVQFVGDVKKRQIERLLGQCRKQFWGLGSISLQDRIERFELALIGEISWDDLESELKFLSEMLRDELKRHHFYHYAPSAAALVLGFDRDWAGIIAKFPSARDDALDAVDSYALEKWTACGFHLMRVLECGLCALARDVNRVYDKQNWHNIIQEIESAIDTERKMLPRGIARDERLTFLSTAAKEFFYFKDGWRNHTAHNRYRYDEPMSRSALEHVRAFMNHLSTHLSE